jgi:hypothetical protein
MKARENHLKQLYLSLKTIAFELLHPTLMAPHHNGGGQATTRENRRHSAGAWTALKKCAGAKQMRLEMTLRRGAAATQIVDELQFFGVVLKFESKLVCTRLLLIGGTRLGHKTAGNSLKIFTVSEEARAMNEREQTDV